MASPGDSQNERPGSRGQPASRPVSRSEAARPGSRGQPASRPLSRSNSSPGLGSRPNSRSQGIGQAPETRQLWEASEALGVPARATSSRASMSRASMSRASMSRASLSRGGQSSQATTSRQSSRKRGGRASTASGTSSLYAKLTGYAASLVQHHDASKMQHSRIRRPKICSGDSSDSSWGSSSDGDDDNNDMIAMPSRQRIANLRQRRIDDQAAGRVMFMDILQDDMRYKEPAYTGYLVDFLIRKRHMKLEWEQASQLLDSDPKGGDDTVRALYGGGIEVVECEKLLATIRNIITVNYKAQDLPAWRSKGNHFKRQAAALIEFKAQELHLDKEVHNWLFKDKIRKGAEVVKHRYRETSHERDDRLAQFWKSFHTSHKLSLLPKEICYEASKNGKRKATPENAQAERQRSSLRTKKDTVMEADAGSISTPAPSPSNQANMSRPASLASAEGQMSPTRSLPRVPTAQHPDDNWKKRAAMSRGGFSRASTAAFGTEGSLKRSAGMSSATSGRWTGLMSRGSEGFGGMESFRSSAGFGDGFAGLGRASSKPGTAAGRVSSRGITPSGAVGPLTLPPATPSGRPGSRATLPGGEITLLPPSSPGNLPPATMLGFKDWGFAQPELSVQKGKAKSVRFLSKGQPPIASSMPTLPSMTTVEEQARPILEKQRCRLPYEKAFKRNAVKDAQQPTQYYHRACSAQYAVPNLIPFCTGDSQKLIATGQSLRDDDLMALITMFESTQKLEEVDLSGNVLLTDRSLVPFMERLQGQWVDGNLTRFSLADCLTKGGFEQYSGLQRVMSNIIQRIHHGMQRLKVLELSGVNMTLSSHLPLCQAIGQHASIQQLGLANVRLSYDHPDVIKCLDNLFGNGSIEDLDLGWNAFDEHVFRYIGLGLVAVENIRSLKVANCACASVTGGSTAEHFIETLERDKALTYLDISCNRLDYRGALVMEAALESNPRLKYFDISQNPLSVLGFRSILRLLSRETSGVTNFECNSCCGSSNVMEAGQGEYKVFSETNPGGKYRLKLNRPYDRALLKMLYRTCKRFNLVPDQGFDVTSPKGYVHPTQDAHGIWPVAMDGELVCSLNVENAMAEALKGVADGAFSEMMDKHFERTRIRPPKNKEVGLFAQWKKTDGQSLEQKTMLEALSKDFHFTFPQFATMCKGNTEIPEIAWRLLPVVIGRERTRFLSLLNMPCLGDYLRTVLLAKNFLHFNIENPTAHYQLDLGNCCDYAVAEQLMLLNNWEVSVCTRRGQAIVSHTGHGTQVRNPRFQNKEIRLKVFSEFRLPEFGTLELDYVSANKPPPGAVALSSDAFDKMLLAVQHAPCEPEDKIAAVSMTSHHWFLLALQMRAMMGIFANAALRAEMYVRLSLRLIDIENEKIFRARFGASETRALAQRLGHAAFFPFIQPEQTDFEFNFEVYDQRLAANFVCRLAAEENRGNIRNFSVTNPDGTVDPMPLGVPRGWDFFEKMPQKGTFRCSYVCSPEDRCYRIRSALMKQYGNAQAPEESKVMWWSSINKCPEDVIEFVEFINSHYKNIWKPFRIIDGEGGNGVITLSEFKEGVDDLNCHKFDGPDKVERMTTVFRYLDPSGEGQVSPVEWQVLDQIYLEIQLSIKEFVEFCVRTFGSDLADAWKALDEDGSGEIDADEWVETLQSQGFFGLAEPIFSYLDKDDTGSVVWNEWIQLEAYKTWTLQEALDKAVKIPEF
eukprot:TRINITY_DN7581_c0_g1_i2.p1 TRINITY_DN7581_c0_g1~~TRINITY_DN7581_c0_g1_i2.p1  ORF type:complete len:1698 (-),score=359.25 TRINITY_DN7581_c0_g1_i2:105-5198(-)